MPELRFNTATKDWVIIATERAKRPEDFAAKPYSVAGDSAANCPFCPGREAKTPQEVFAVRDPGTLPNTAGWKVRVIPNAFPALKSEGMPVRGKSAAGFLKMDGVGIHEVIIETPDHNKIMATMTAAEAEAVFLAYKDRFLALTKDPRFEAVILFKNHGHSAGTSLSHPHSQIISVPVMPRSFRERLEIASEYFDAIGSCLYCEMIKMEQEEALRVVVETDNFLAFCPFASRFPFETWVVPKKHSSNFDDLVIEHCRELARVMQQALSKLYHTLNNPDFNYAIYSAPCRERNLESYHWHIKIFPRVSLAAGFELGSGIMINTVLPEAAAQYLRNEAK